MSAHTGGDLFFPLRSADGHFRYIWVVRLSARINIGDSAMGGGQLSAHLARDYPPKGFLPFLVAVERVRPTHMPAVYGSPSLANEVDGGRLGRGAGSDAAPSTGRPRVAR